MTLIADVVTTVMAAPAPVLFLDSCILLDIVRAPLRNKAADVQFARLLLDSVRKTPKTIHLLIASPTQTEWNNHIDEAVTDCTSSERLQCRRVDMRPHDSSRGGCPSGCRAQPANYAAPTIRRPPRRSHHH